MHKPQGITEQTSLTKFKISQNVSIKEENSIYEPRLCMTDKMGEK
jgi:hypothetical protein